MRYVIQIAVIYLRMLYKSQSNTLLKLVYFRYLTEIQLYDHSLSSLLYRSVFDRCSHFVALVNLCEGDFIQKYFSYLHWLQAIFLCICGLLW